MRDCVSVVIYALVNAFKQFFESVEFKFFLVKFKSNFKLVKVWI